jgi:hypothetical protein
MASRNYVPAYQALRTDQRLREQCEMFILIGACVTIRAESPATANHAARVAWATEMETDAAKLATAVERLAVKCVQNTSIVAAVASSQAAEDSDVEYVGSLYLPDLIAMGA